MECKTIAQQPVASFALTTNLIAISETVGVVPALIADELKHQGIPIVGAQIWQYDGCDGDPQRDFSLKITFPVSAFGADTDKIKFETLAQFTCISVTHQGCWDGLKGAYAKLFAYCVQNGLQMNGYSREVYLHCDFENAENCITEIQLGINK